MSDQIATEILSLTAQIVSAHLSNNSAETSTLPALIRSVYRSLSAASGRQPEPTRTLTPAVPVKKSVFLDYIVCLEDGKKFKMLKGHLNSSFGLTPEAYRTKWGLPSDYPMVAPSYAAKRATLAKSIGVGRRPAGAIADIEIDAEPEVTKLPTRRARGSEG